MAAAACFLALVFLPARGLAQTDHSPCYDPKASADATITSCSELLSSGSLSATNRPIAYYDRGIGYEAKGQIDLAFADYTAALSLNPNYFEAFTNRGNMYRRKGQDDLAIADYTTSLRINPNYVLAYNNRGFVYHTKGQDDSAITDYNAALRIDPNYVFALKNRGYALFDMGRFNDAASDFGRAVDLQPSSAYAVLWLHAALRRSGVADPDLAKRSAALSTTWPSPIVAIFLNQKTPEPVLSAAQECEGTFFAAEAQLWDDEIAHARSLFTHLISTCPRSEAEYIAAAQAELTRLPK